MIKSKWALGTLVIATIAMASPIILTPQTAEAKSFLEMIFGKKTEEPKGPPPEVTLQAPFPTTPNMTPAESQSELMKMYGSSDKQQSSISLDQPHRSPQQIAEWAAGIASQAMTVNPATWESDFAKIAPDFTPFATQEYKTYIKDTNLINILASNQMRLQAISNDSAIVTKEGQISGTYHWLIQIPLMTSYYKTSMREVDKNAIAQSQSLLIQMQVGRIPAKNDADIGLTVERWHVSRTAPTN